jgi:hypothetical protein
MALVIGIINELLCRSRCVSIVWFEKIHVKLTPFLELALTEAVLVRNGFIESFLAACITDNENREAITKSPVPVGKNSSPTTVLEFSFDDAFES